MKSKTQKAIALALSFVLFFEYIWKSPTSSVRTAIFVGVWLLLTSWTLTIIGRLESFRKDWETTKDFRNFINAFLNSEETQKAVDKRLEAAAREANSARKMMDLFHRGGPAALGIDWSSTNTQDLGNKFEQTRRSVCDSFEESNTRFQRLCELAKRCGYFFYIEVRQKQGDYLQEERTPKAS